MSVSVSTVEAANPAGLLQAAGTLNDKITQLDTTLAEQRRAVAHLREAWEGQAASAALARAERNLDNQEALRARLSAMQQALASGGAQLTSTRDRLLRLVGMLRSTGWRIADDGTATAPPVPPILKLFAPAWTAVIKKLLAVFTEIDTQTAAAVREAASGPVPATPPGTPGDARQLPAGDTDPDDVKEWWDSLSQAERDGLIAAHPPELGNLNGIPAEVRGEVNEKVMNDDLDRVRDAAEEHGVSVDQVLENPAAYGLSATDAARYHNAEQTRKGLAQARDEDIRNRPVLLWAYEPLAFDGQGKAALAIGDPDKAQNTAVVVPGTGSSVEQGWLESSNAVDLYDQMRKADPDETTSVIAWMGYDAPDSPIDRRIATPWLARHGGDLLAADVNGFAATHEGGPSNVTVIGHSYGSTTVANAFAGSGMQADNAVLIGSPGTDLARSAADFNLPGGGNVYVGAASSDPVTWLGQGGIAPDLINSQLGFPLGPAAGLGTDPAGDSYGGVRFTAEVPGRTGPSFGDHSSYYTPGSESLRAITDIATGDAAKLADNGMIAEGRKQAHIGLPDGLNTPFGRIDLPDWEIRIPGTPAYNDPEGDRAQESITSDHNY